jgi:hypothetical protein
VLPILKKITLKLLFFLIPSYLNIAFAQIDTLYSPFSSQVGFGKFKCSGDFNNDGYNDLAVTCYKVLNKHGEFVGAVVVYYGNSECLSDTPEFMYTGQIPGHSYGITQCVAGDFNNDGFDDLSVSNPAFGEPQLERGYIQIFWGSKAGLTDKNQLLKIGKTAYGSFGNNLGCIDYNNDGIDDLVVEARFDYMLEGRIYIYTGGYNFSVEKPDYELQVENSQSLYIAFFDDINEDGAIDVIARSNFNWNANIALLYTFFGGKKPDNLYDRYDKISDFTPKFIIKDQSGHRKLILGIFSDHLYNYTTIAFDTQTKEKYNHLQMNGYPAKINNNQFIVYKKEPIQDINLYSINNKCIIKQKYLYSFKDSCSISDPFLFSLNYNAKKQLIFPIKKKGREFLIFIELP